MHAFSSFFFFLFFSSFFFLLSFPLFLQTGFNDAENLGKKMTVLYKLASEQLSQQYHYGFGLREMATVLVMAGTLKRSEPDLTEDGEMSSLLFSFVSNSFENTIF